MEKQDMIFGAILSGDQIAQAFLRQGTTEQNLAAKRYINAKQAMLRFYELSQEEENVCGKPHNNGEETCAECMAIQSGL